MKGWFLIRWFVFGFIAGALSLLLVDGIAIYASPSETEDEKRHRGRHLALR